MTIRVVWFSQQLDSDGSHQETQPYCGHVHEWSREFNQQPWFVSIILGPKSIALFCQSVVFQVGHQIAKPLSTVQESIKYQKIHWCDYRIVFWENSWVIPTEQNKHIYFQFWIACIRQNYISLVDIIGFWLSWNTVKQFRHLEEPELRAPMSWCFLLKWVEWETKFTLEWELLFFFFYLTNI